MPSLSVKYQQHKLHTWLHSSWLVPFIRIVQACKVGIASSGMRYDAQVGGWRCVLSGPTTMSAKKRHSTHHQQSFRVYDATMQACTHAGFGSRYLCYIYDHNWSPRSYVWISYNSTAKVQEACHNVTIIVANSSHRSCCMKNCSEVWMNFRLAA